MAVVVAKRHGLHVAATRFVASHSLSGEQKQAFEELGRIQADVAARAKVGASYGNLYETLARSYARFGHRGAWKEHFQGGPIGYEQREFEISPEDLTSPWFLEGVELGQAIAFNPSYRGGFKVEDTYLLGTDGPKRVTESSEWPTMIFDDDFPVANVLEI